MASIYGAKTSQTLNFFVQVIIISIFIHHSVSQSVPAMYVFGDSLVDVGNNNHLALSLIKADFPYNGIDYPGKKPTGRFCNGKNAADVLAEKLGLASAPAYLSQPNNAFVKGVSFASGGAGIFNDTNEGRVISLARQVNYFSTVRQRIVNEMGAAAAQEHLSKSLIPVVIGSNDILNYFAKGSDQSENNTPQQYVDLMVSTFKELLKGIYGLGGRKFLVVGLSPIGCAPKQRLGNKASECNKDVNFWSKKYNDGLAQMLRALKADIKDFHYSYFDIYTIFSNFAENPTAYGFNETKSACCGFGKLRADLPCTPVAVFCSNRSSHLFWDIYHPTEAAVRKFMNILFGGSADYVSPVTLDQLIAI